MLKNIENIFILLTACMLLNSCNPIDTTKEKNVVNVEKTAEIVKSTVEEKDKTLFDLLTPEIIGAEISWIENKIGPAKYIEGDQRNYMVSNCRLTIKVSKNKVNSFSVPTTDDCSFNISRFSRIETDSTIPLSNHLTFEQASEIAGGVPQWNCLQDCGNVEPPAIYMVGGGSHVTNYMDIVVSRNLDFNSEKIDKWKESVDQIKDYCDEKFAEKLAEALKDVRVDYIEIGFDVSSSMSDLSGCHI